MSIYHLNKINLSRLLQTLKLETPSRCDIDEGESHTLQFEQQQRGGADIIIGSISHVKVAEEKVVDVRVEVVARELFIGRRRAASSRA